MPSLILLAGPNGAGKSTTAPSLLRDEVGPITFLNADTVAQGLSSYRPEDVAIQAGRVVLQRIKDLGVKGESFAVETTLAGRGYVRLVRHLKNRGYRFQLVFLWLPSPAFALARVAARVRAGGHAIPEEVIRRRYQQGLANLFNLYLPLADRWLVYDGSGLEPKLLAYKDPDQQPVPVRVDLWHTLLDQWTRI